MKNQLPIILGCMSWGSWGKKMKPSQMAKLIDQISDLGLRVYDHADIYGDYTTEAEFGNALKDASTQRTDIELISKCGIQMVNDARKTTTKHYDLRKNYIIRSAEQSLKNLQTDYLDTLLIHRPSPLMQAEEIAAAAHQLIQEGKIKHFGVSNFTASQMALLSACIDISCNQVEFSLNQSKILTNGDMDFCMQHNIEVMSWSPLGSVFDLTYDNKPLKTCLEELSGQYACTMDTLLYAWILFHPKGIQPVIGTAQIERMQHAIKATDIQLIQADWFKLWEASRGQEVD